MLPVLPVPVEGELAGADGTVETEEDEAGAGAAGTEGAVETEEDEGGEARAGTGGK